MQKLSLDICTFAEFKLTIILEISSGFVEAKVVQGVQSTHRLICLRSYSVEMCPMTKSAFHSSDLLYVIDCANQFFCLTMDQKNHAKCDG